MSYTHLYRQQREQLIALGLLDDQRDDRNCCPKSTEPNTDGKINEDDRLHRIKVCSAEEYLYAARQLRALAPHLATPVPKPQKNIVAGKICSTHDTDSPEFEGNDCEADAKENDTKNYNTFRAGQPVRDKLHVFHTLKLCCDVLRTSSYFGEQLTEEELKMVKEIGSYANRRDKACNTDD